MRLISLFLLFNACFINANAQTWQQENNFPGLERDDAVAVTVGNVAYYGLGLAVGWINQNDWWSYDRVNGWQQKAMFPGAPRQYAACTSLGKYVYVFGGVDAAIVPLNDFWRYDTENDSWENLTSLPSVGRQAPALISLHTNLLLGLGRNDTTYFNDFWLYDPVKDTFMSTTSLPTAGRYYPLAVNVAGNAFIAHGRNASQCFNDIWRYDEFNKEWIFVSTSLFTACNYAVATSKGYQLIMGAGLNDSGTYLNDFYSFDISTNTWTQFLYLPAIPRKGSSAFILEGDFYLINGIDNSNTRLNEIWRLSFAEDDAINMIISPNPVQDWLNIYLPFTATQNCKSQTGLSVYDISGRKLMNADLNFGYWTSLDCSALPSGLYILKVENCVGIRNLKVVVQ